MPRKSKAPKKRRESSGKRWERQRAQKVQSRLLVESSKNVHRIDCDSMEFACLFAVEGGTDSIGPGVIRAFDLNGNRPGKACAPKILGMDRGKVAVLAERWEDVAALAAIRENRSLEKKQIQVNRILSATERDAFGWYRQEVPDQSLRSILIGSNNGCDPTLESDSLVVCHKGEDGRYYIVEEQWDGAWSEPDADGFRQRINVETDPLCVVDGNGEYVLDGNGNRKTITFHDENEAQKAILLAARIGKLDRFADRVDPNHLRRIAGSLKAWEHKGKNRKQIFG